MEERVGERRRSLKAHLQPLKPPPHVSRPSKICPRPQTPDPRPNHPLRQPPPRNPILLQNPWKHSRIPLPPRPFPSTPVKPPPPARLSQPQPVAAPATSDHQPSSDRQSVPLSSISVNGGTGRGEAALNKNAPSTSQTSTACEPSVQNPPQTLDPRRQIPPPVPSPCIGVCKFNDGGYCKTCFRSTIEKARWPILGESGRAQVVDACAKRRARWHPASPEVSP